MVIHFVCSGNTFRSRLAEAYLSSQKKLGLTATSSGIRAQLNYDGPVHWLAALLLRRHRLVPFMSDNWRQTSKFLLREADLVIFLARDYEEFCRENFALDWGKTSYRVWEIADLRIEHSEAIDEVDYNQVVEEGERVWSKIKSKVDELLREESILSGGAS